MNKTIRDRRGKYTEKEVDYLIKTCLRDDADTSYTEQFIAPISTPSSLSYSQLPGMLEHDERD